MKHEVNIDNFLTLIYWVKTFSTVEGYIFKHEELLEKASMINTPKKLMYSGEYGLFDKKPYALLNNISNAKEAFKTAGMYMVDHTDILIDLDQHILATVGLDESQNQKFLMPQVNFLSKVQPEKDSMLLTISQA